MSGGFLPDFDMAEPAKSVHEARPAVDDHPWTTKDDVALKKAMVEFKILPDEQKPWPLIATKAKFGHNSGSCKARWAILSKQTSEQKYHNVKSISFGAKGGAIVGKVGMFNTEVAISG